MGLRTRHVPGCNCCPSCDYEASDGNVYTDTFGSLDAGWTASNCTLLASGTLTMRWNIGSFLARGYRTVTGYSMDDIKIILEANIYQKTDSLNTGIFFSFDGDPPNFHLFATWGTGYGWRYTSGRGANRLTTLNSTTSVVPSSGDKLTIKITDVGDHGENIRACYFVNGQFLADTGSLTSEYTEWFSGSITANEAFGVTADPNTSTRPVITGEWDNLSLHIGNP